MMRLSEEMHRAIGWGELANPNATQRLERRMD